MWGFHEYVDNLQEQPNNRDYYYETSDEQCDRPRCTSSPYYDDDDYCAWWEQTGEDIAEAESQTPGAEVDLFYSKDLRSFQEMTSFQLGYIPT